MRSPLNSPGLPIATVIRRAGVSSTVIVALAMGLVSGSVSCATGQTRDALERASIEPHVGDVLPGAVTFNDHRGNPVQLAELTRERPALICLVYFECPMLCKLAADGLVRAVSRLRENVGDEFNVAFISFDPRDTPQRAAAARDQAMGQYERDPQGNGWYFLTGNASAIRQLTDAVGFRYAWDERSGQFAHASGLVVIAKDGTITEYLDGVHFAPKELASALDRAARREQRPREATTFVRCYLYDPTTGRVGSIVQWTLRALGGLTVLAMAALVGRLILHPARVLPRG